jgi:CheY-like chemotaxis protein
VAKILVADDNSNVQKTVALALVDLGIEVVAVNNGEAAVRKLADVSPDLVLADIFMPVRNGYEVCEYVKKNARFSHLPVVLLVGAFDPLDEREAQRVGADGILKKPFVPPDPLITMVKMLLERTLGDRLVTVGASETAATARGKAGGMATVEEHLIASTSGTVTPIPEELPEEDFLPPVDRVSFGDGARPMAFGDLLETPTEEFAQSVPGVIEPVQDEQILTSSRDASLGDPIFWKTEEPQPEADEENAEEDQEISSGTSLRAWKPEEKAMTPLEETDFLQPVEPIDLVRDDIDAESRQTSSIVESTPIIAQDPASQAELTVKAGKLNDLAANPLEWMASVPAPPTEESLLTPQEWSGALEEAADGNAESETQKLETSAPAPAAPEFAVAGAAPVADAEQPQSTNAALIPDPPIKSLPSLNAPGQKADDTARSVPKQDWADLTAGFQIKPIEAEEDKNRSASAPVAQVPATPAVESQLSTASSLSPIAKPVDPSTEDTAHSLPKHPWADLAANLMPKHTETISGTINEVSAAEISASDLDAHSEPTPDAPRAFATAANDGPRDSNPASPASPDPALVEAIVQRILEKMRPQVVDIITKEFLRPIVQALVHREVQKR